MNNVIAAQAERDAANDALRLAWDIEDAVGPNEASDIEIERLRVIAEKADDALVDAKRADVADYFRTLDDLEARDDADPRLVAVA